MPYQLIFVNIRLNETKEEKKLKLKLRKRVVSVDTALLELNVSQKISFFAVETLIDIRCYLQSKTCMFHERFYWFAPKDCREVGPEFWLIRLDLVNSFEANILKQSI